ncbi:60S ribosomal protein L10a [Pseudoloma neurophilia]|uniref:60S ribosomal protein L10a n=1 Tax=Pseudoloma neurophilia TaxID=146866 RepID=A0A0R0LVX2_9MICR|nr:60S ribosomal protein L10a [Pseudoloma neurophilia]
MSNFMNKDKVLGQIMTIKKQCKRPTETLEVQMCLKGYDYKKDVRFDSNVVLPYPKRKHERILVIADKNLEPKAVELGVEFKKFEEVEGNNKEKNTLKKKLAMKYHSFISTPAYNSVFSIKIFNRKRKPVFIIRNPDELQKFYNDVTRMVKFKLKKTNDLSFTIGFAEMTDEELLANYMAGMNFLNTLLKKGVKSLGGVVLKSCQGKPIRLH